MAILYNLKHKNITHTPAILGRPVTGDHLISNMVYWIQSVNTKGTDDGGTHVQSVAII
jgi:hypothetical protein